MLAAVLAFALAATPLRARDTVQVDACTVAPLEQLRFLIAAGIGRGFPVTRKADAVQVAFADPTLLGATCAPLKVEVRLIVRLASAPGDSAVGSARVAAALAARVAYQSGRSRGAPGADALADARLCFRDVTVTSLDLPRAPRVDASQVRAWIDESFRHRDCFDITSLVYVFLQRGGKLPPSP